MTNNYIIMDLFFVIGKAKRNQFITREILRMFGETKLIVCLLSKSRKVCLLGYFQFFLEKNTHK